MATGDGFRAGEIASFGPFRLSPSERLLAEDGRPVAVGGRALDILITLIERAGEVVSRRELVERVWPDVIVEEANLRVHLSNLRKALADGRDGARYITNIPGRGYCFVGTVRRSGGTAAAGRETAAGPTPPPVSTPQQLPPRLGRMVGRDETVAALCALLSSQRFVSIVGPGGMGKTTVAVAVAHALAGHFDGAVYFVDLAAVSDGARVVTAVASALGRFAQAQDPMPGLLAFLAEKPVLVVLDNCEHVVDAVGALSERLFREAALVHLLTTSHEALRVDGENVHLLTPLEGPVEDAGLNAAQALASPAVQLFMERAAAGGYRSELSDADAPLVAGICNRLDGIALALELAAGRVGAYGIRGTAELLDNRFKLLWRGRRSALPRHQTLQAMLDWSYNLLSEREQTVLTRLSIFVGVFTLEDALAVVPATAAEKPDVAEAVASLLEKSLVWTSEIAGSTYHRLLETTRAYAAAKLAQTGEEDAVARRHALHHTRRLGADKGSTAFGRRDLSAHAAQIGNVRAALGWSFSEQGETAIGVELAAGSAPLFLRLSLLAECEHWCERGVAALRAEDRGTRRELALQEALAISSMFTRGNSDAVRAAIERGLALAEALDDHEYQLRLLAGLNIFLTRVGDFRAALAFAERSVPVAAASGDPAGIVMAEWMLGVAHHLVGNQGPAQHHCERGLELAAEFGGIDVDFFGYDHRVRALVALARALWLRGLPERALGVAHEAIDEAAKRDYPVTVCIAFIYTIPVFLWTGDLDGAGERIERLIAHAAKYSLGPYHAVGLALRGELMTMRGDAAGGVGLLRGAVATLRAERHHILATVFSRALAEGLAACGQPGEAAATIAGAVAFAEKGGQTFDLPDLLRAQAEILLTAGPTHETAAEQLLLRAIERAREQSAVSWELRAAMPLARLWGRRGSAERGREMLFGIIARFAEGLESIDLKAARSLVRELTGASGANSLAPAGAAG